MLGFKLEKYQKINQIFVFCHFIESSSYICTMLVVLQQVKVASQEDPKVLVTFKNLLLNRCQTEFEKDKKDATQFEQMQKDIEAAETVSTSHGYLQLICQIEL